ncbi:MAG TPA: alpha-glucosidase/alpha-galactosidase [Candidatus Hydrogenedentes bacterium]|nr:alpha-glucosidase/alpha-galactosidase [Candidatus Hydrogenedentota bacterium]HPO30519.1 alpha-glucosidase/alpha-galactosidase [Candidatus Hydrogenedentota bacterium]
MAKICFLGAGSTVFARNVLGDCMRVEALRGSTVALVDIDPERLEDSRLVVEKLNAALNAGFRVDAFLSADAESALRDADYVINAIQVGGYEPATVRDFEIPKRFGLRQTIGDTLGIGGIFRALRIIPVLLDYCRVLERVAPDALLLNYANPMAMLTWAVLKATSIRCVGLCHSVQVCASHLCEELDLPSDNLRWRIAGINHQAWLLEISRGGVDLYPEIRRRAQLETYRVKDAVRFEIMKRFGYYVTESSEHNAEYTPWFIRNAYPELIDRYRIPLDEYPRRCLEQIARWKELRASLLSDAPITHERTHEYASYILEAIETGRPYTFGGNVLNTGLIPNLPAGCCVEVMCVADRNGITPTYAGPLPTQCAALNRTNINVQELAVEAALTRSRDRVYQAALLDPHTAAELTIDDIVAMCDALFDAHRDMLPDYH